MNTGWEKRLEILLGDADRMILEPLRIHGWVAKIVQEVERGEYLIIEAERGGHCHQIALLYSSATDNKVYKRIATEVEHIYVKGQLYEVKSYAYGIDKPIDSADDFHDLLLQWNQSSAAGKFAPTNGAEISAHPPKHRVLLSEQPIEAIWLRLRQLQSVTLATKLVRERAGEANVLLDDAAVHEKAEGIAFALRNTADYFQARETRNVSQRVLNLYYGSLAFAFAEMLALPTGAKTLSEIEDSTKQGHGLYTIDGDRDGLEHLVVGVIATGFFPSWMKSMGLPVDSIPTKKPRSFRDLVGVDPSAWLTIERLLARIPEVSDLFSDIFDGPPAWVTPVFDMSANKALALFGKNERPNRSYIQLVDDSARLTKEVVATFPGPLSEIAEIVSEYPGRHFRAAVDHRDKDLWNSLPVHHSPFERNALIRPVFGVVGEYRAICVVLLYGLSIVVRYRPSLWRRVQGGDLDHLRVLIEAFLAVVERVLPEQFLEKVTGRMVFAKQPGSLF